MDKICAYCKHLWNSESYEYSTYTQGGGYITCNKGHWMYSPDDPIAEFKVKIKTAATCKDFDDSEEAA